MTPNSLALQTIIDYLLENESYIFWYAKRNGIIEQLTLRLGYTNDNDSLFCRYHSIEIDALNIISNKKYSKILKAGIMYDNYSKYGHFFLNRSEAIKFLFQRKDKISKKSRLYILKYPEYLI